jgi:hypothetical protein
MQQPVEKNLGDDDEHGGVGVHAAIASDQADVVSREAPADGSRLHLLQLLLGEGNQRRRIIGPPTGVQGLKEGCLGDQRFAHPGRGANEDALIGREVGQQRFFLHRVGRERKLIEIERSELIAGGRRSGHSRILAAG